MINPINEINPIYLVFEFVTYALFAACFWHAARTYGRHRVLELVFTLIYGVLLEWLTIRQLAAYRYGQFLVMIDDAPLVIGMGWAVIIYSAMEFTGRLRMPDMARPLFDALLALNIDLSMDAIAIRLMDGVTPGQGMWHWGAITTQNAEWFGVPWANFWAWFFVVASYSLFVRWLRPWRAHAVRNWLYVPLAFGLSLFTLLLSNEIFRSVMVPLNARFTGPLVVVGGALAIVIGTRPRVQHAGPPEPVVLAVPLAFHLIYMGAALLTGIYAQTPALAVVGVSMFVIGIAVHLWPWWVGRREAAVAPTSSA